MSWRSSVRVFSSCLVLLMTAMTEVTRPLVVHAAEEVRLLVGGPLVFSVSVDSLEAFAKSGEINSDLRLFMRFANEQAQTGLRQALQANIPLSVQQVDNLGYSVLGQDVLFNLGKVIRPHPSLNGDRALRAAMITAAAQAREEAKNEQMSLEIPQWTAIDVLRQYPSQTIDIRWQDLQPLRRFVSALISGNEKVVAAIQSQAALESSNLTADWPTPTQNLSEPGPYAFEASTLTLTRNAERQTRSGVQPRYSFGVNTYIPQGLAEPAPVVIVSHGYSDTQENFGFIGRHLASHGFVVLIPEHVGSDLQFRLNYTEGRLQTGMNPTEYVSRPQEISYLIDQLEMQAASSPILSASLNLKQIGIIGHSLGASTAYSLAGAEINFDYLKARCESSSVQLSPALYVQCLARLLPEQSNTLKDSRIKAIVAANGISSALFGPAELGQIKLPVLMVSAANDVVAPSVSEQIQPFAWLGSPEKYLAVMSDASHFSFMSGEDPNVVSPFTQPGAEAVADLVFGQYREIGAEYFEALNLAFWNVHLKGEAEYLPYLSDRYAQQLSDEHLPSLNLVREIQLD